MLHITNVVSSTPVETHIASQSPELFEGLGKLSWTKIKLYIDTEVKPTAQRHEAQSGRIKSPNEVRICVDMRLPNKAIQRERHITPTMDHILYDLNGATVSWIPQYDT